MNTLTRTALFLAAIFFLPPTLLPAADKITRKDLGRSVKLTILVDKVMQPKEGWVTKEWMIREATEAGFNVYSPRIGYERLDEVRRVAGWCKKYGIYHMPWMRGSLTAPQGPKADGKRLVWANGNEQPLWSPNSDEFWKWTHRYIVEYAKISRENPHLMGVFLDYENYAPRKQGNLYDLSYDEEIMGKFARSKGIELPRLALDKRKVWLEGRKLHDAFAKFQVAHWRERCRALRQAVDRHDTSFQFCIYPAPGTPFMVKAAYPEWSSKKAPIILADPYVYGRPGKFLSQKDSLAGNRKKLLRNMEVPRKAGIPFIYSGGIDPVVRGADPEFSGKNAVMISQVTDGYWIFYEGPKYDKPDHAEYWKWFTWANKAIAKGRFDVQHERRKTPSEWGKLDVFKKIAKAFTPPKSRSAGRKTKYPTVKLRGDGLLMIACKKGRRVEVNLANHPLGNYRSKLAWEIRGPLGSKNSEKKIASGTIPHAGKGTAGFTPETDGVYLLGGDAGQCSWSVASSNVPVGIYARDWLRLIRGAKRLYFHVPAGLDKFTINIRGWGMETVRANIYGPTGKRMATAQTTPDRQQAAVQVSTGSRGGKGAASVWSVEITRADKGTLEDNAIRLDPKLPPTLSLVKEQVFEVKK